MNPDLFIPFLLLTLVLILTPGPIVTLMISTGATQGPRAVLATSVGTMAGNTVLIGSVAFGLSLVLASAAVVFEVIRWAGVAYLIWLGVQAFRRAGQGAAAPAPGGVHVSRGFLVAVSNPKTMAFFTAFLPQFVDPSLPTTFQLAVMVAVSVLLSGLLDAAWGIAAGFGRAWFLAPSRQKLLGRVSGAVLIGGGVWLALSRRPA
ncbi:MAG: LysE family translocator [Rhodoplanes sp.]|uniref:LysE family translocator n=1 Tax=Rhodoplanes sp. TaxID=1968906 RepID=UPI001800751D|nr:LysE family translocator [Rhodoplanes sp.]NVO17389.1 LysE family translocator [Rhodoplanes sp.]